MADHFRTPPDWEDIRFFLALARHGSLSAAARTLGVTHATVSRRTAALEASLGARLFERRQDGYALTPDGQRILTTAAAMERAAADLSRGAEAAQALGRVRVTATPSLAESVLIPRLAAFQRAHPSLDIDVISDRRAISLQRREADVAVRLARPLEGELRAKRLVGLGFGFYGGPDWQARVGAGQAPEFIGFDDSGAHLPEALWLSQSFPGARFAFRSNSQGAQAIAARAGCGIALLPHFIAAGDPDLHPIDLSAAPPGRELWLLMRNEDPVLPGVRLVVDHLTDLFRSERTRFEHRVPSPESRPAP